MKLKYKVFILVLLFFILLGAFNISNADMGAKPTLTVYVKNFDTRNYTLTLLSYIDDGYKPLSSHFLWDGTTGEYDNSTKQMKHYFMTYGFPSEIKIAINKQSGEVLETDVIKISDFNSVITLDMNTMNTTRGYSFQFLTFIKFMIITIVVELIIAWILKIRKYNKYIIIVNIISQIFLQTFLVLMVKMLGYMAVFIVGEIIVFLLEYILYRKLLKEIDNRTIITYVIIANTITAGLTFLL